METKGRRQDQKVLRLKVRGTRNNLKLMNQRTADMVPVGRAEPSHRSSSPMLSAMIIASQDTSSTETGVQNVCRRADAAAHTTLAKRSHRCPSCLGTMPTWGAGGQSGRKQRNLQKRSESGMDMHR